MAILGERQQDHRTETDAEFYAKAEPRSGIVQRIAQTEDFLPSRARMSATAATAIYSPASDHVQMPPVESFRDEESFYSSVLKPRER